MDPSVPSSQARPTQQPTSTPSVPSPVTEDTPVSAPASSSAQPANYTPNKEFAPMGSSGAPSEQGGQAEDDDDEDAIKVARQEVMHGTKVAPVQEVPVSQELKEFGVEQGADKEEEIPVIVQHAGVRSTSTDSALPVSATGSIKLPISYAHADQLDKGSKIKESIKWLARFIKRQWERVRFLEKHKQEELPNI